LLYSQSHSFTLHRDGLVSVASLFPDRSLRWVAESCRAGRIPGARRIGKVWFVRPTDFAAFVSGNEATRDVPTEAEATADLRRRGIL